MVPINTSTSNKRSIDDQYRNVVSTVSFLAKGKSLYLRSMEINGSFFLTINFRNKNNNKVPPKNIPETVNISKGRKRRLTTHTKPNNKSRK